MGIKENKTIKNIVQAVRDSDAKKTKGYDTQATVTRVEDGVAWVHIPGGVSETPAKLTIDAKEGDSVMVRVAGGRAFLLGNATNPPTDDATARKAYNSALDAVKSSARAFAAAESAEESAETAREAAAAAKATTDEINAYAETAGKTVTQILDDGEKAGAAAQEAKASAENASEYAARALGNLSTVQSVTETLNWITQHGTMTPTTDTELDPTHIYFVVDPNGDYTVSGTKYAVVAEPSADDLSTYYELSIDESLNNYVATHLAVTSEGLWLIPEDNATPQSSSKKILIAVGGQGHSYPESGTYIIEKVNSADEVVAKFTASGSTIGSESGTHSIIDEDGMQIYSVDDGDNLVQLANIGYGETLDPSGKVIDPYYTFGKRLEGSNIGSFSFAEGIGVTSSGYTSHAEGYYTQATGPYSHAEGQETEAVGPEAHAEGYRTKANASYSHAEGCRTKVDLHAMAGHAQNWGTIATQNYQTAIGSFNEEDMGTGSRRKLFIVGNGLSESSRSNAFSVDWFGDVFVRGEALLQPIGTVVSYAGATAPNGWLLCDGSLAPLDKYTLLYTVIGDTYGPGIPDEAFNLPDLRGRMPIGAGQGSGLTNRPLGRKGGAEGIQQHKHTHDNPTVDSSGKMTNGITGGSHHHSMTNFSSGSGSESAYMTTSNRSRTSRNTSSDTHTHDLPNHTHTLSGGGVGNVTNLPSGQTIGDSGNMSPYLGINFIIFAGVPTL